MTVFPVQFAKLSILWNPVIYICMNKSVRIIILYYIASFKNLFQFQVGFCKILPLSLSKRCLPLKASTEVLEFQEGGDNIGSWMVLSETCSKINRSFRKKWVKLSKHFFIPFFRIRSPSHSLQNIKSASVENPCLLDISGGEHATHFLILIVAFQDRFLRSIKMFLFWIPAPVFSMVNLKYSITKKGRCIDVRKA